MRLFPATVSVGAIVGFGLTGWATWAYLSAETVVPADGSASAPSFVAQAPVHEVAAAVDRVEAYPRDVATSVPLHALKQLRMAVAEGAAPSMDLRLSDPAAWERFSKTWEELSVPVFRATSARDDVGIRISQKRFESRQCAQVPESGLERDPSGATKPVGVWGERRHPQEWVSTRFSYRDGEGQILEQVRIMPGEESELDAANMQLASVTEQRLDAIRQLFAEYAFAPGGGAGESSAPMQSKRDPR